MEKHREAKEAKEATAAAGQKEPQQHNSAASGMCNRTQSDLQQQLNEKDLLTKQLNDYKDSLQRLQAEFENYKKRVDKEKAQFRQFAAAEVVRSFLPVLDGFELALKSFSSIKSEDKNETAADDKIVMGVKMIYAQFYLALESLGLKQISAFGERFDPYKHEVLMQEETTDEKEDGIIVEEFQKGYTLNDIVLRYSKVNVLKFVAKEKSEEKARL